MTDPLSISASVAGLVSLAAAVTQSCYGLYREIKNAPRLIKDVIDELNLLRQVLVDLKDVCDQTREPLQPLDNVIKDLKYCEKRLGDFEKKLASKFGNPRGMLSRFRWSFDNSEIRAFVNQLQSYRSLFDSAKANATLQLALAIRKDVSSGLLLDDIARKEKRLKSILDWLSPLDFSESQNDFYEVRREPGTSEWIEREANYIEWRDRDVPYANDYKRTLWCYGPPGSGKTVACSVLVNNLLQLPGNVGVAYMYCSSSHQRMQMANILVGALIRQLVIRKTHHGQLPDVVEELHESAGAANTPNLKSLVQLLRDVTIMFDQAYIVVDGIDEVGNELYQRLLDAALDMTPANKTKFLVSSRSHDPRIARYLTHGLTIAVNALDSDVSNYLRRQIDRDENLGMVAGHNPVLVNRIVSTISRQCDGLFALARLHLQRVSEQTNKAAVVEELKLPVKSLQHEYDRSMARMKRLPPPRYQLALRTIFYMAQSRVPLTPEELQDALSTEAKSLGPSGDRRPPIALIVSVCLGFVFENPISLNMEFFHATVAEYLSTSKVTSDLELDFGGCCVIYLLSQDLARRCVTEKQAEQRRNQYPFGSYASRFWGDMIRGQSELKHKDALLRFLISDNRISSLQLLPPDMTYNEELIGSRAEWFGVTIDAQSFAVYTCAYLRLNEIMPSLLSKGFDPSYTAPLGLHSSPLHVGVKALNLKICETLIDAGVDPNVQDKTGRTPLHFAWQLSGAEAFDIREMLANSGGQVDITDLQGRNVLQNALHFGNTQADIYSLVNKLGESQIHHQDENGDTALHIAVTRHYYIVIKHLLANGANPLIRNRKGQRPLDLAIEDCDHGSIDIVRLIQGHIERHKSECILGPSDEVAIAGFFERFKRKDSRIQTTSSRWYHLASNARQDIVAAAEQQDPYDLSGYLLSMQDVDFVDEGSGMSLLHHAILSGHEMPVWHLLAADADLNLKDQRHGLTGFEMAQKSDNPSITALFRLDDAPGDRSPPNLMWQKKYYQVGRGIWSKRICGNELRHAYRSVHSLRDRRSRSSFWSGPGPEMWYDYLGYGGSEDKG